MNEKNRRIILLELALHRYDEEVERNKSTDNKNKSMVAFLAVMLTIQSTILIRLIEFNGFIRSDEMNFLVMLFIISFVFNLFSLLCYLSTLRYLNMLKSSPKIDNLVYFGINKTPFENIIENTIVSLNKSVKENKSILKEKSAKENYGIIFLRLGLIATTIFIMLFVLILL